MRSKNKNFKGGLTDDQVILILTRIACLADVMGRLAMQSAASTTDSDAEYAFHSIHAMSSMLGALADMPGGTDFIGSLADWSIGPMFAEKGAA